MSRILYFGCSFFISSFSTISARFSFSTIMNSILRTSATIRCKRIVNCSIRVYATMRFFIFFALPTYKTAPFSSSIRYTPGVSGATLTFSRRTFSPNLISNIFNQHTPTFYRYSGNHAFGTRVLKYKCPLFRYTRNINQ